ncbi:MAG: ATP-dependent sacrificial sulfur transferase LarE, partial [Candidatus Omnitrophica bacterium]|nr:ATP-dependent sacrificial sulfur transferase LarE [Candidatus Omnitrophota bacterium]
MNKNKISKIKYQKLNKLTVILKKMGKVVVAFSGGVDSSLLLKVAVDSLGKEKVLAVTVRSPVHPEREYKEARKLSRRLGIVHIAIKVDLLKNKRFLKNPFNRCFHCKKEIFSILKSSAENRGFDFVIDGSNYDDRLDFRPGSYALKILNIRSPLKEARWTKRDIRAMARIYRLPNWNKLSQPCLVTRIPYYSKITRGKLRVIESSEDFLKNLGFRQIRVRYCADTARIETACDEINKIADLAIRD